MNERSYEFFRVRCYGKPERMRWTRRWLWYRAQHGQRVIVVECTPQVLLWRIE